MRGKGETIAGMSDSKSCAAKGAEKCGITSREKESREFKMRGVIVCFFDDEINQKRGTFLV